MTWILTLRSLSDRQDWWVCPNGWSKRPWKKWLKKVINHVGLYFLPKISDRDWWSFQWITGSSIDPCHFAHCLSLVWEATRTLQSMHTFAGFCFAFEWFSGHVVDRNCCMLRCIWDHFTILIKSWSHSDFGHGNKLGSSWVLQTCDGTSAPYSSCGSRQTRWK